jgi:aminoglycoside phosphotransferase (APT) family kinase protein
VLTSTDHQRASALARYLVRLHSSKLDEPARYLRAVRDMIGGGEGIFGIVDSYSDQVPAAPRGRLSGIEELAVQWRTRLRQRTHRLRRTHGDYHPFNLLFTAAGELALLDTSRGSVGDPADDVTALSMNYLFFAAQDPSSWRAFGVLWHRFWDAYMSESGDREVLDVAPPFLAWRGLVLANPVWYPAVHAAARERILGFVERALSADQFHPRDAEEMFR